MPREFEVRSFRRGDTQVVVPVGELDMSSAPKLHECALKALAGTCTTLVLDLRELEYMDSTGLRLALQIQGECRDADRDFALVHGPDNVRRLFAISDLLEVLPFREAADIDLAGVDGGGISPLA